MNQKVMPHTVVTGANSFVAAQVIATLISQGHTVTGSVRHKSAGDAVLKEHPEWQEKLDFIEIRDYATPGIWDDFFKTRKVEHIVAVAAPMYGNENYTDYERDWLNPGVNK
jgi:nucleoside-diphosphate-sugar epimerase